mmetsp:Transcript_15461/g.25562  ORF Transcript_15461/g.25562 Transcript_15461/m.25562 type:complete len:104 (+) Transcript_15461:593-904(+)
MSHSLPTRPQKTPPGSRKHILETNSSYFRSQRTHSFIDIVECVGFFVLNFAEHSCTSFSSSSSSSSTSLRSRRRPLSFINDVVGFFNVTAEERTASSVLIIIQ